MALIGEIKLWAGTYAPQGWAFCAGQLLPISDHELLYATIGTIYGGDGSTTFALPDLRGRVPVHQGPSYPLGLLTGSEKVALLAAQLPQHGHAVAAAATATGGNPAGNVWAAIASEESAPYSTAAANAVMADACIGQTGSGVPHENMMPYLVLNYIIALEQTYDDTPISPRCGDLPLAASRKAGWRAMAACLRSRPTRPCSR
ncbi:phage tail protein [Sphingomonas changnyeongensis]|uniref:Phage tail protein n=1 Tax=Sphingomonas changnyeongensis TaxID=2698679 RepID=A0A7Z2NU04_9SPHN|nr:tail fiber protein [Sphingomonas changnyeongensis]QHL89567.1 phage tail protein [Sphingomonas changnyeongensis]